MLMRAGTPAGGRGFTLLELMVALAVAALTLAVVPLAVERLFDGTQYRATVRDMMVTLRSARHTAMSSGKATVFRVDLNAHRYGLGERLDKTLPEGLSVSLEVAADALSGQGIGSIHFYPDGSSTGGSVLVTRGADAGVRLRVGWLLGRISLHPA